MRVLIQRVLEASVSINHTVIATIGKGLCVFLGIGRNDSEQDTVCLAKKIIHLRVFPNVSGKMSFSVADVHGDIMVVSQFTLYGNCKSGCRPDFTQAAPPEVAEPLYENFLIEVEKELLKPPKTGHFREQMAVSLVNDGPVTLLIESTPKKTCGYDVL